MRLCKFTFTIISSLPCLHTFWHAIPTSFYIFNVFFFKSCININAWYQLGKCATYKDETFEQDEPIKLSFSAIDLFSPTQMQCHQRQHLSHCTHSLPFRCLHFSQCRHLLDSLAHSLCFVCLCLKRNMWKVAM